MVIYGLDKCIFSYWMKEGLNEQGKLMKLRDFLFFAEINKIEKHLASLRKKTQERGDITTDDGYKKDYKRQL